jgi:hypothetical protein
VPNIPDFKFQQVLFTRLTRNSILAPRNHQNAEKLLLLAMSAASGILTLFSVLIFLKNLFLNQISVRKTKCDGVQPGKLATSFRSNNRVNSYSSLWPVCEEGGCRSELFVRDREAEEEWLLKGVCSEHINSGIDWLTFSFHEVMSQAWKLGFRNLNEGVGGRLLMGLRNMQL